MTGFIHDLPFGAQVQPDGRVRFRLWAPGQDGVSLVVEQQDAVPLERRGDLRAAAVDDDRAKTGVTQEDDVLGERTLKRDVGHRVAAELDDDGPAVEALQPWQRLDEGGRLLQRGRAAGLRRGGRGRVE